MTPKIKKWFVEKSGIGVQDLGIQIALQGTRYA